MATILDIIFSIILGGILLLTVLDANQIASENASIYNGDMLVQELLIGTVQRLEGELKNMGFGVPQGQAAVVAADTDRISFLVDLPPTPGIDNVTYYAGPTSELSGTMNELDRYVYRRQNGAAPEKAGVVTILKFRYLDQSGNVIVTPVSSDELSAIYIVEVTMEVQNPYAQLRDPGTVGEGQRNAFYSSSLWQQTRLASQNSRR
jgi:hypothetical protein